MKDFFKLFAGLLVVIIMIGVGAFYFQSFITKETIEISVINITEMKAQDGGKYYLVHTEEEVFENRNYQLHNKDNADKLAKTLKPGGKYKVSVVGYDFGFNIPLFLEHRNIIEVLDKIEEKKSIIRRLQ